MCGGSSFICRDSLAVSAGAAAEIVVYSSSSLQFHHLCVNMRNACAGSLASTCTSEAAEGMGFQCLRGCGALRARW